MFQPGDVRVRRAVEAGRDIVILNTQPYTSPAHDVLEAALAERLPAEAGVTGRTCEEFTAERGGLHDGSRGPGTGTAYAELQREALRVSHLDVVVLDHVAFVFAFAVAAAAQVIRIVRASHPAGIPGADSPGAGRRRRSACAICTDVLRAV